AEPYCRDALSMYEQLYPRDKYPQGHPDLAQSLDNLGSLLQEQGEYATAEGYYRDALSMCQQLYPKARYPQGHPSLARSLTSLGGVLWAQGEYVRAEPYCRNALVMLQQLYPKDKYPQGYPNLAGSLYNLGSVLWAQGENAQAEPYLRDALQMYQDLANRLAHSVPEAQALNFAASFPLTRDVFLSVARCLPNPAGSGYALVWQSKAALTRVYERRHLALLAATAPQVHERWQRLLALRRQREHLLLAPIPANPTARDQKLAELNQAVDQLDRELLPLLPAVARAEQLAQSRPGDLQQRLPPHTVLIDLLRYTFFEQDPKTPVEKGRRTTPSYVAYLLTRERVVRVELGPAHALEELVHDWRASLTAWKPSLPEGSRQDLERRAAGQAERLRRLVWEPLAQHLPADTQTVYLAPDAVLTQLPWAALPGNRKGTVLLEDYTLAVLPHGPFLLDRLTAPTPALPGAGPLLAVGGVRYDDRPTPVPAAVAAGPLVQRSRAAPGTHLWEYLEGSARELQQVTALAQGRAVQPLSGAAASTDRVVAALPKARYAHLATHGFFADKSFRSVLQLDEKLFARREFWTGQIGERRGEGARNPLVLSGLVLAGANLPDVPDRGILTADALVGLNLSGLELVVLSACETGLGDVAGGEGVFGLQRAFHLAGTRDVIASLWKVDDHATAALMTRFYHALWKDKLPPLEALRQAQLALYRDPKHLAAWANRERGVNLKPMPATAPVAPAAPWLSGRTPVKLWAGFVLSGTGR
ncbi:MAG: CHAT domain-containing protein, partial [Gemmataceae bacterium]|nr:CHAT domain-containing protein [Gemmataceae bacterium]